ncbi:MAG: hypothetical protein KJN85_15025 [Maribacter sp.]|nr:hypothetical protein [Maribacter sp.]
MRTPIYLATILTLLGMACKGRAPEEQKMMEDMGKEAMEAQRQYDSVMKSPQVKKIMQQTEAMEAQTKIDWNKRNAEKQKKNQKPNIPKKNYEAYVISKSNTKKFDNWSYGEADITMGGFASRQTDPGYNKKIGTIKVDGSFEIKLPEKVSPRSTIKENRWLGCGYFGDKGKIDYSNSNTGVKENRYIHIKINDQLIGLLFMASAIEVIDGWNPLQHHYHDIPGYRLEWFYVGGETSAKGRCVKENRYGEGKDFDITTVFDMQLKPGWNLVKREFDGPRINIDWGEGEHNKHSYYKEEKITAVTLLPADAKWVFKAN